MSKELQTLIEFDIPFAIPIADGLYPIRLRGKTAEIYVRKIYRKEYGGWKVEGGVAEFPLDKHGRFAYSHIIVRLPWKADPNELGRKPLLIDTPPRQKIKEIALEFVNRLIDVVRYVTDEYHLEHVTYPDISSYDVEYFDGQQKFPVVKTLLSTGVGGIKITAGRPETLPESLKRKILELLANEGELELSKVLILNAKDAALSEDYRRATLESVTALEVDLYRFIRERGKQLQIAEDKLDNFIIEVGLTGNLEVVLKMLTAGLEPPDIQLLTVCKGAITTRNDILHRGLIEVPATETEMRISKIESFLAYLKRVTERIRTSKNANRA
mgnify:CR=1 FL=1